MSGSGFISRAFRGRRRTPEELADRLPPGQYYEPGYPVLTAGPTPRIAPEEWGFRIDGMVALTMAFGIAPLKATEREREYKVLII